VVCNLCISKAIITRETENNCRNVLCFTRNGGLTDTSSEIDFSDAVFVEIPDSEQIFFRNLIVFYRVLYHL